MKTAQSKIILRLVADRYQQTNKNIKSIRYDIKCQDLKDSLLRAEEARMKSINDIYSAFLNDKIDYDIAHKLINQTYKI